MNVQPFMKPEDFDLTVPPGWNRTKHFLLDALEYEQGLYTLDDVLQALKAGTLQFWPAENSALVTDLVQHPQGLQLEYWLAGGDLKELRQLASLVESWAMQKGAICAKITGRRWARALEGDWKEVATISVKRLDNV